MAVCSICAGVRWVLATPQPMRGFHIPAGGFDAEPDANRARNALPRIPCPQGCEPWPWDVARLAVDAGRLNEVAKAA